jgi:DNA-binding NtrC family response regulator
MTADAPSPTPLSLRILFVDDDPDIRAFVCPDLRAAGHEVDEAQDGAQALVRLGSKVYDVIVCDLRMPKVDGLTVLRRTRKEWPTTEVILITSFGAVPDAVAALKEGASDYLAKPFDTAELTFRIDAIGERLALRRELDEARIRLAAGGGGELVGESPPMARVRERIAAVAPSDAPILITGESGTGKELAARAIHARSARRDKPFVAVSCAAFPETLLEAELFGHERGAFTGAMKRRDGRFKTASGGTLLLDEVGEIPLSAQAKLLRVLQDGVIEPLGTDTSVKVDVRLLSATNRDLKKRIAEGLFREDLYYRLNAVEIALPPLRDRPGDLALLANHFLRRVIPAGTPLPEISLEAWGALTKYPFPGNARELGHAMQHAALLSHGRTIELSHLPEDIVGAVSVEKEGAAVRGPLSETMKRFEREQLLFALAAARGKRVRAAEMLGISRKNLWEKLKAHGISDSDLED